MNTENTSVVKSTKDKKSTVEDKRQNETDFCDLCHKMFPADLYGWEEVNEDVWACASCVREIDAEAEENRAEEQEFQ